MSTIKNTFQIQMNLYHAIKSDKKCQAIFEQTRTGAFNKNALSAEYKLRKCLKRTLDTLQRHTKCMAIIDLMLPYENEYQPIKMILDLHEELLYDEAENLLESYKHFYDFNDTEDYDLPKIGAINILYDFYKNLEFDLI